MTLTLKVCDGLYVHKDIIECGKDISSMLNVGKTLKIGDDMFKDLDEVGTFISAIIKGAPVSYFCYMPV